MSPDVSLRHSGCNAGHANAAGHPGIGLRLRGDRQGVFQRRDAPGAVKPACTGLRGQVVAVVADVLEACCWEVDAAR